MSCTHDYRHTTRGMFAPRVCVRCGAVACDHVWAPRPDGVPQCTSCGKRAHWSPSALERVETCERKQGYAARSAQRDRENKFAAFGVRAHKVREDYLRHGTWTAEIARSPEGVCVATGIPHWPMPGDPGLVAVELELETDVMGVPASRKIDSVSMYRSRTYARADDLKTIGRVSYAKSVEDLIEDTQRTLYAYDIGVIASVPTVGAQWTYCQRDGKAEARAVEFEEAWSITRERVGDVVLPRARELVALRLRPLEEHARNLDACNKYGSLCEYASHCHVGVDVLAHVHAAMYTPENPSDTRTPKGPRHVTTLADTLAAQAAAASAAASAANVPPMPSAPPAPAPRAPIALTAELEEWVAKSAAAGHDVRAQAEQAMIDRGLVPAPTTPSAPPLPAPAPAPAPAPVPAPAPLPAAPPVVTPPAPEVGPKPEAPKAIGGRPPKGAAVSLLEKCAAANMDPCNASQYLELLARVSA